MVRIRISKDFKIFAPGEGDEVEPTPALDRGRFFIEGIKPNGTGPFPSVAMAESSDLSSGQRTDLKYRQKNRPQHREYMREYMKKRRAKIKAEKAAKGQPDE